MTDNPTGVVGAFFHALGERHVDTAATYLAADAGVLVPTADGTSVESGGSFVRNLTTAFPDLQIEVRNSFAAGDTVVVELTMEGTQSEDHAGIPAQAKHFSLDQAWLVDVNGGHITNATAFWCQNALYRQLGAPLPAREGIAAS